MRGEEWNAENQKLRFCPCTAEAVAAVRTSTHHGGESNPH